MMEAVGIPRRSIFDTVVHTARTAGSSISHPSNEDVHAIKHVLDGFGLGGKRCRMLAEHSDFLEAVLFLQNSPELV